MAEVPVTINGVICDLYGRTITGPVKIVGSIMLTGLGVGGGPIIPDKPGGGPPGIWPGPGDPDYPGGGKPPSVWPGPGDPDYPAGSPHPEHPIVLPPGWGDGPPTEPPPSGGVKPPPPGGGWGYHPEYGWGYFPGNGGKPQPPAKQVG